MRLVAPLLLAALTGLPTLAHAQADAPKPAPKAGEDKVIDLVNKTAAEEGLFSFDWGVPASPSLKLLGQGEDKVPVANSLKALAVQLPGLVGNSKSGESFGLDVSPAWLIGDASTRTYNGYLESGPAYRILYRTRIGVAGYEGIDDADPKKSKRSRVSFGLSTSLLDDSDPLVARLPGQRQSAWQSCLDSRSAIVQAELDKVSEGDAGKRKALEDEQIALIGEREASKTKITDLARQIANDPDNALLLDRLTLESSNLSRIQNRSKAIDGELRALTDQANTNLEKRFAKTDAIKVLPDCAKRANFAARYGQSLSIGVGGLWDGDPGQFDNLEDGGWVVWASYRRPLQFSIGADDGDLVPQSYWMWGGSVRAGFGEMVKTGVTAMPQAKADTVDAWLGVERLTETSRLSIQGGWQWREVDGGLVGYDRERWRYFVSYSTRLGEETSGVWLRLGYGHVEDGETDDESILVSLVYAPPAAPNLFSTR